MQLSDEEQSAYYKRCRTLLDGGISDFTSAARLANTIEAEKAARLKLFRVGCSDDTLMAAILGSNRSRIIVAAKEHRWS